jgi:hypothetical protein
MEIVLRVQYSLQLDFILRPSGHDILFLDFVEGRFERFGGEHASVESQTLVFTFTLASSYQRPKREI